MFYFNKFFKKNENTSEEKGKVKNKEHAKERLHLVLMQDRANVSADFLDMMRQEIIDVIKKYVNVDDKEIDVKLTNKQNSDGTVGAPALYANIPFKSVKSEIKLEINKEENTKQKAKREKIEAEVKAQIADEKKNEEIEKKTSKKTEKKSVEPAEKKKKAEKIETPKTSK